MYDKRSSKRDLTVFFGDCGVLRREMRDQYMKAVKK